MKNHVEISVVTQYIAERSRPGTSWFYAYTITMTNRGTTSCKLLSRHWIITDGLGNEEEVRGPGVVGETPHLDPDQSFSYTSACPLPTPSGSMRGTYQMVNDNGDAFDAEITQFALMQEQNLN
jgi:ApaG protein